MNENKRILLIDGNNYCWSAFHAYTKLSYKGKGTGMIYGMPQMVKSLVKEYIPDELILVWDAGRSKHRQRLLPGYKGDRNHKSLVDMDDWQNQYLETFHLWNCLGIKQVASGEADDMIYKLTLKARKMGYNDIIIASSDKDFNQLISREVRVYNPKRQMLIDWMNCSKEFGYHPYQTVDWLTLLGDKSDNIPGYPGIGPVKATKLLQTYGNIDKFLEHKDSFPGIDKEELRKLSYQSEILISLRGHHERYGNEHPIRFIGPELKSDKKRFLQLCAKYGMTKMMSGGFFDLFQNYMGRK